MFYLKKHIDTSLQYGKDVSHDTDEMNNVSLMRLFF